MLNRREFIATSAAVAGAAGVPVAASSAIARIAKPKGLRLISQMSDKKWRRPSYVWTPDDWERTHLIVLAVESKAATFFRALHMSLHGRANATRFGGIDPGFLFAQGFDARREADEWIIQLALVESTTSRLAPQKFVAIGHLYTVPAIYRGANFSAYLPRVESFPEAIGHEPEAIGA